MDTPSGQQWFVALLAAGVCLLPVVSLLLVQGFVLFARSLGTHRTLGCLAFAVLGLVIFAVRREGFPRRSA